jgi:hypothetical protein
VFLAHVSFLRLLAALSALAARFRLADMVLPNAATPVAQFCEAFRRGARAGDGSYRQPDSVRQRA